MLVEPTGERNTKNASRRLWFMTNGFKFRHPGPTQSHMQRSLLAASRVTAKVKGRNPSRSVSMAQHGPLCIAIRRFVPHYLRMFLRLSYHPESDYCAIRRLKQPNR
ncbi:hypothetical protein PGTUg99_034396 [Puccinia graminis f. sp. tritici]|uniref:Uncharacterized protein n=1 Tax=Puccinia graminis f. sp. tritici TaxID=56615 RepID=A0A5B0LW12_PUCGR|nr:hypothetical protein PGTUg99_034396 [Puccinia graminis f. sp. tritici]